MFTKLEDNANLDMRHLIDKSKLKRKLKKNEMARHIIAGTIIVRKARYYFRLLIRAYEFRGSLFPWNISHSIAEADNSRRHRYLQLR